VRILAAVGYKIIIVDNLAYSGDLERLKGVANLKNFYRVDICSRKRMRQIFRDEKPQIIVHFAAQTHVDRSIIDSSNFLKTNILGTQVILDIVRSSTIKKYIHISTDEVYGQTIDKKFSEENPLNPTNPYAVSKASADLLVNAYLKTYQVPAIIVRPSNNYGPWQYPEKFIPLIIYKALRKQKIPIYAQGLNRREWLYVSDCAKGILTILNNGRIGEVYNLGSGTVIENIQLAKKIISILGASEKLIKFVKDRPGHDFCYFLDSSKAHNLGWQPHIDLEDGIRMTTQWYRNNIKWLEKKAALLKPYWKSVYRN